MGTLRTEESHQKYLKLIAEGILKNGCNLCKAPSIKDFEYWRIIDNKFPYDLIASVSHMIIPKRHTIEINLTNEEKKELEIIKSTYIQQNYELLLLQTNRGSSIPGHFHTHLITLKERISV